MKTYSPEVLAALASGEVGIVQMIEMAFPVTPIRLNSSNMDLVWQRRYNLATYSQDFNGPAWVGYFDGVTVATGFAAPDGTNTASRLTMNAGGPYPGNNGIINVGTLAMGQSYLVSIWLKADTLSQIVIAMDDSSATSQAITGEWRRYSFFASPNGTGRVFQMRGDGVSGSWFAWGLQVEIAETPSAYTPTTDTPLTDIGVVYKGAYGLGQISPITDKPGEVQGITLELHGADDARISLALDEADIVQGTPLTLRTAIISLDTFTILDAPVDWVGTLDTMATAEDGDTAAISVTAESRAVDLLRGNVLMYTDADQRAINPNDGAFRYVVDQIDKPVIWPAKAFFQR